MSKPHLNLKERFALQQMDMQGKSYHHMARFLGRHHSTIAREFKRNCPHAEYVYTEAHDLAQERKSRGHQRPRLKSEDMKAHVEARLIEGWSPEQIAGRLRREKAKVTISHEAIYQWLYNERPELCIYLCHKRNNRHPRGYSRKVGNSGILGRVDITHRPKYINERKQPGHWEVDTMMGPAGSSYNLAVCVERKTRYMHIEVLKNKSPRTMQQRLQRYFGKLPKRLRRTITYDNGFENRDHWKINQDLNMRSFFCQPYRSWEKGTVENTIGLIRRYLPKGTDLTHVSRKQIRLIEQRMNARPREILKYNTPQEAYDGVAITP